MKLAAFEGLVEDGKVCLPPDVQLPDKTRVVIVIPDLEHTPTASILSPRLLHPEQASEFKKEMIEDSSDAVV